MFESKIPDWLLSIHHDGSEEYVSNQNPQIGELVRLRIRIWINAPVREIYLRTFPDGEQALQPMKKRSQIDPCQWWDTELEISQRVINYRFLIIADDGMWNYSAAGPHAYIPLDSQDFRILANYQAPEWVRSAVFYQIFPDRFANGDKDNDPDPGEFNYKGYSPQTYPWGADPDPDQIFPLIFYGGDLKGLANKLGYLRELGINALYLNPIFSANSNHKYDVIDYFNVDPHFGGNKDLVQLRNALDNQDMRYILDIVPNHCGYWHPWFQTAQLDHNSTEANFFTFNEHPDDYATWLGVWTLPKLNYKSEELRQRIYKQQDSVFRFWLSPPYRADGWRVDVANMLGRQGEIQIAAEITSGIRQSVKESNPEAYLIGENFFDATNQLQGDQFDGVMNYAGFALPLLYWLGSYREWAHSIGYHISAHKSLSTSAMANTWLSRLASIPWPIALQQFNILDSHDTPRIKSILKGNLALHRLAVIIQFTFPGVPCVYYGDELGMDNDPILESRGCMIWDRTEWDQNIFAFYQQIIELRKKAKVLQNGGFQIIYLEEDTLAYIRHNSEEGILVVAHRSEDPRPKGSIPMNFGGVPNGTRFKEYFSGQELYVENGGLLLPPQSQGATLWIQS